MTTLMVASSHKYKAMAENTDLISDFHSWDEDKLGLYFKEKGLGSYCEALKNHKITGKLAPLLTDEDLKEMGVNIVGDRLMFKHQLKELARRERFNKRIEALWEVRSIAKK